MLLLRLPCRLMRRLLIVAARADDARAPGGGFDAQRSSSARFGVRSQYDCSAAAAATTLRSLRGAVGNATLVCTNWSSCLLSAGFALLSLTMHRSNARPLWTGQRVFLGWLRARRSERPAAC